MNFLLQPWHLVIFAVVMFFVFLAMGKLSRRPK
jgi:hypothetical protein